MDLLINDAKLKYFFLMYLTQMQDLIVLFSDTLIRALRQEMVTQDMVDECDPSLMFAIPRYQIFWQIFV
jgi:hypothetical protein